MAYSQRPRSRALGPVRPPRRAPVRRLGRQSATTSCARTTAGATAPTAVHGDPGATARARSCPKKARVDSYPVEERHGWVWVFMGDLPEADRVPIPDLAVHGRPETTGRSAASGCGTRTTSGSSRTAPTSRTPPFVHRGRVRQPERRRGRRVRDRDREWDATLSVEQRPPRSRPAGSGSSAHAEGDPPPPVLVRTAFFFPAIVMIDLDHPEPGPPDHLGHEHPGRRGHDADQVRRAAQLLHDAVGRPDRARMVRKVFAAGRRRRPGGAPRADPRGDERRAAPALGPDVARVPAGPPAGGRPRLLGARHGRGHEERRVRSSRARTAASPGSSGRGCSRRHRRRAADALSGSSPSRRSDTAGSSACRQTRGVRRGARPRRASRWCWCSS